MRRPIVGYAGVSPRLSAVDAGSITWVGCLSYDDYYNSVSPITRNVLQTFPEDGLWATGARAGESP